MYLALFRLFSVIDGFEWFWIGSSRKNIQLMLQFLGFHSWSYTYHTIHQWWCYLQYCYSCWWYYSLLKMWSGIWFVAITRVGFWPLIWSTRHCRCGLLISMLEELNLFHLTGLIPLVIFMWKWTGLLLKKNISQYAGTVFLFRTGLGHLHCFFLLKLLFVSKNLP